MAKGAPLLEALFQIPGVRQVMVSEDRVVVEKSGDEAWRSLGPKIGAVLRAHLSDGKPVVFPDVRGPAPALLRQRVEAVLKERINPAIAAHGGRADLVDVKGSAVYLRLSGGCQGCGSAQVTLKYGIEKMIFEEVPEVSEVVDVTDHASGAAPYYASSGTGPSPFSSL
jgi:Fe-S cluster biogenesis protein NfuA